MISAEASRAIITHAAAFTHLYELFLNRAPTSEVIAAFKESADTLHDLLRVSEHTMFREANGAFEAWLQWRDQLPR